MEAELIGRDEELQRMQRFLEAVPAGGRALLIAGEAGVGKTSLWKAGVARGQGKVKWKTAPCPGAISAQMRPPWASTTLRAM